MHAKEVKSIHDAQSFLGELYPNNNYDTDYIYGYLSRYSGYLSKKIWQKRSEEIDFIRTVSWIIAICNKIEMNLEQHLLDRYPHCCPYCLSTTCKCRKTGKRPAERIPAYRIPDELRGRANSRRNIGDVITFDYIGNIIETVYPQNEIVWESSGPWRHLVKIQEEAAELHEALSGFLNKKKPIDIVGEECADLMAWILSAWKIVYPNSIFDHAFIHYYIHDCPVCSAKPCICAERQERASQLPDPAILRELEQKVVELSQSLSTKSEEIELICKSLSAAQSQPGEVISRQAVVETRSVIESIEKGLDRTDSGAQKALSIIKKIKEIVGLFSFLQ